MSNITVKANGRPTASQVRAWGRENAFKGKTEAMVSPNTRGRLSPVLIAAFNETRKGVHRYDSKNLAAKGTVVKVKPAKGASKTVRYSAKAARAALAEKGIEVKATGRLPKAALADLILNG